MGELYAYAWAVRLRPEAYATEGAKGDVWSAHSNGGGDGGGGSSQAAPDMKGQCGLRSASTADAVAGPMPFSPVSSSSAACSSSSNSSSQMMGGNATFFFPRQGAPAGQRAVEPQGAIRLLASDLLGCPSAAAPR